MVVIRARLSPEDGAVVLAAIEAAGRDSDPAGADVCAQTPPPVAGGAAREGGPGDAGDVSAETWGGREVFYEGRPPVGVLMHVDQAVLADPGSGGCCHVEGVGAIAAHTARRLACDAASPPSCTGPTVMRSPDRSQPGCAVASGLAVGVRFPGRLGRGRPMGWPGSRRCCR